MSYRAAATGLFALASLAPAACAPDVCGQRCGLAGECPSGFVCAGDGQCVPEHDRAACGGLDEPRPPYPTGSTPPAEAGASGFDSTAGAGVGPVSSPGPLPLVIGVRAPSDSCASDSVEIELGASGGNSASYAWRLLDATGGFTPLEASGSRWVLSGAPAEPGALELRVELSDGDTSIEQSIALVVHERPRLASERMPALCPGERVALALAAEGGDPGSYEFSADLDPALGLRLEGASLVGRFSPLGVAARDVAASSVAAGNAAASAIATSTAAPPSVTLAVRDRHCASGPRELPIDVLPAGSAACPQILVSAAGTTQASLPPPCLGSDYEQAIVALPAEAGAGTWREVATAPGLHFDPAERVVRGTPLGEGVITLQLAAEPGRIIEADFPVNPRERCWLAYVANRDGSPRLRLFDPHLPEQPTARRVFPDPADDGAAGDVLDFAFSPRGRFLAYRLAPEGAEAQLRLLDLWTWSEPELELPGSVEAYAWSASSAAAEALAVAFDAGGEARLGGLMLSPAAESSAPGAGALAPLAAPDLVFFRAVPAPVLSGLAWFDADHVGFLAPDPLFAPARLFQWARVDAGLVSLEPARERLQFFDDARFQPAPGGILVVDTVTGQPHYYASNGDEVDHGPGMLLSPSGAFIARAAGGTLSVFRVTDRSVLESDPAWAQAEGCAALLAWARGRERIACAAQGDEGLAFFDLPDPELPELVPLARVQGDYRLRSGQHIGHPRLFAAGGGRFAFTTDADVYVVQLDDGAPRIEAGAPLSLLSLAPGRPVQLSFSAQSHFLSVHGGDSLALWRLDAAGAPLGRIQGSSSEPSACSESSFDALPWCGAEAGERVARWSADEGALVFRSAAGELEVLDVSQALLGGPREVAVEPGCGDGCLPPGTYTFQP